MDMEDKLTEIIADLKTTASQAGETQVSKLVLISGTIVLTSV